MFEKKQLVSKVLIFALLCSMAPTSVFAEEGDAAPLPQAATPVVETPAVVPPVVVPENVTLPQNLTEVPDVESQPQSEESVPPQEPAPASISDEATVPEPAPQEPESAVDISLATTTPDETQTTDNPQEASSTPLLQGASDGGQDAIPPTEIATSTTIEIATTTPEVIVDPAPIDESATTTEESSEETPPVEENTPEETPTEIVPQEEQAPVVDNPNPEPTPVPQVVEDVPSPMQISQEELIPDPDFVFSVNTGKRINAKRMVKKEQVVGKKIVTTEVEEAITMAPTVTADNQDGVMNISGSCNDKYYTVLLFKNAEDYERDRRAFVVNKAYPCEGGTFNYELSDLPPTLKDGTYYLMIGSQGDTSPWVPISALTEVTINNNRDQQ